MAAPLIVATLMMLATATLAALVWMGGTASGERVAITLEGPCAEDASGLIEARVHAIGLGDPEVQLQTGQLHILATLPGVEDELETIPAVLGQPGNIEIHSEGQVILSRGEVREASIRLDEAGAPYVWLDLDPAAIPQLEEQLAANPEGEWHFFIDGSLAAVRPNSRGIKDDGLRLIAPGDMTPAERLRRAADASIVLSHGPLPCALQATTTTALASPQTAE